MSTDVPQQAGEPAVAEHAVPGGAQQSARQELPAWHGGRRASGPAAGEQVAGWHRRRRRGWVAVVAVVVVAATGAGAYAAGAFHSARRSAGSNAGYATQTRPVTRGSLTEQTSEDGTLGDAGSYPVVVSEALSGAEASTFTWLPSVGQTVRQGQMIYQVSGTPVVLLYGSVPAYRDLSEGMTGADATELNTDLVKLGYATAAALGPRAGWDYFSAATAAGVGLLQARLGLAVTGTLPLGQATFLPGPIRVTGLGTGAFPGGQATAGATVLTASSLTPVVTLSLDASMQTQLAAGNAVSVTMPDGSVTPGVISHVSVASAASSSQPDGSATPGGQGSGGSTATITVVVSLTDPSAAKGLNQVPVQVTITTGAVRDVLIVPVDALLARPGGGYEVEVTGPGGHRLVKVTPGMFDDAAGTVQVTGHLTPGERVVVPGI
ncbi:MAG TPA: hypothetical protein VGI58_19430 [Streptosporangiaceae bacterium]